MSGGDDQPEAPMSALKQVFVRVHFRYDQDRYAEDLEKFAEWLLANGYPNKTARTHLFRVQQVLHAVSAAPGAALHADILQRAFRRLTRRRWKKCHTHPTYAGYLRSIGRLIEPAPAPEPLVALVEDFCRRLERRRGLAMSTIVGYRSAILDFLQRTLSPGQPLTELKPSSLQSYVRSRGPQLTRTTLLGAVRCIQAFLLDGYHYGRLSQRLDLIDLPRGFRRDLPPRALPWPLVERLLQSIDRTGRTGRRDHAMLHLMAYYGLRTGEVPLLTLSSINREARTLTVWQRKTSSTLVLPLHDQTLTILDDYLSVARPRTELPWLFLRGVAPLAPMTNASASYVFRTRARRSGLPLSQYSAYSLRHAFAHRLFQRGVGMKAIGDLMGHGSLVSTSVYLRLQADTLREVALPVPGHKEPIGGVA
jgi:integrase/recombinase XerD